MRVIPVVVLGCSMLGCLACQTLTGLDEDRRLARDLADAASLGVADAADVDAESGAGCAEGAARCNLGRPEACEAGEWKAGADCYGPCVGGQCLPVQVNSARHHTCVRLPDGKVSCWGRDDLGQLGQSAVESCELDNGLIGLCSSRPLAVPGVSGVSQLSSLDHHVCAVSGGRVLCWGGANEFGQLGRNNFDSNSEPGEVELLTDAVQVAAGGGGGGVPLSFRAAHTCALTASGALVCWGANCTGQLGLAGEGGACPETCPEGSGGENVAVPTPVSLLFTPIQVAAGAAHTCALSSEGEVWCWGLNSYWQVDVDAEQCVWQPRRVAGVNDVVQVACGALVTCALHVDGHVTCWGMQRNRLFGEDPPELSGVPPMEITGIDNAVQVSPGPGSHACARRGGEAWCWGENENGEIGFHDSIVGGLATPGTVWPARNVGLVNVVDVSAGGNHSCAWQSNLMLQCWGERRRGAVGDGRLDGIALPTVVDLTTAGNVSSADGG